MSKLYPFGELENNIDLILEEPYGEYGQTTAVIRTFRDELDERMEQLKVFYPFMDILRRNRVKEEPGYPVAELCMSVLTFLLHEGRLKFQGLLFKDIEEFVIRTVHMLTDRQLTEEDALSLTDTILDELQNNGANYTVPYYSFFDAVRKEKHVKLIEMKLSDEDGKLYYHITKQGLDFYLKTKEFPEESQITINLLLFKLQLEKGSFTYAYNTVKRLNMEVQRKLERKNYILGLLMAGGSEGAVAYREYHQSTLLQFDEETQLFNESRNLLQDTFDDFQNKISRNTITEKEKRAYQMVKRIEAEMRKAIRSHENLLKEATSLVKEYDRILDLRRKTAFTERFNFIGEFDKIINKGLPTESLRFLFEPLILPNIKKSFNPLRIFMAQKITSTEDEPDSIFEEEVELSQIETTDMLVQARVAQNFVIYAAGLLIHCLGKELNLREWCNILSTQYGSEAISNVDFLSFLIVLNRGKLPGERTRQYRLNEDKTDIDGLRTMEDVLHAAAIKYSIPTDGFTLEVESKDEDDIDLGSGIKVTNMFFRGIKYE
ncbi:MAG: hypothetical protein GX796_09595 [Clostridiaceae bacterium]|jgi:hypothetical protein|nr:hypothetical protein [Clostridiaceae bacterium]